MESGMEARMGSVLARRQPKGDFVPGKSEKVQSMEDSDGQSSH
jgi:hypothetical protein